MAAEGLDQEARCVTEETVPPRLGHVSHARHGQHEKGGQAAERRPLRHSRRTYIDAAATRCVPEQAI